MTDEKKGLNKDELKGLNDLLSGANAYLQPKQEESARQEAAISVLEKVLGGNREAAIEVFRSPSGDEAVNRATNTIFETAVNGFYENIEENLMGIKEDRYVSALDSGNFVDLAKGDDDKSKSFRSYVSALKKFKIISEGDKDAVEKLIKDETKGLEKEIKENYEKSDDPVVKGMSDKQREGWIKTAVGAYEGRLASGEYKVVAQQKFLKAKEKYDKAFENDAGKAEFTRELLTELANTDEKGRVGAYLAYTELSEPPKKGE